MISQEVTINNKTGLHARPAAKFVQNADQFKSKIEIFFDGKLVNAKSIMGILSLGSKQGSQIIIRAEGEDEEEAVKQLVCFIKQGLDEK